MLDEMDAVSLAPLGVGVHGIADLGGGAAFTYAATFAQAGVVPPDTGLAGPRTGRVRVSTPSPQGRLFARAALSTSAEVHVRPAHSSKSVGGQISRT